jgi:hypothetical protein
MGFEIPFFQGSNRNAEKRGQEYANHARDMKIHNHNEEVSFRDYNYNKLAYANKLKDDEDNLRFAERDRIQSYIDNQTLQDFDFESAAIAYNQSVGIRDRQKDFNFIAEQAALMEQHTKKRDDLVAVAFEEAQTLVDHAYKTTGIKINRHNKLVEADFQEAKFKNQYTKDIADQNLERNRTISKSQVDAQKAILEGMKAAGAIRARGSGGRSSSKAAIAVLAESGANRAAIANSLMYAEQEIDLNIAQLKDMLILDQTMVLAARDSAENTFRLETDKANTDLGIDKYRISETKHSIALRDNVVKQKIANARLQADMNAEAAVMVEPRPLPRLTDPREHYKGNDNPDTEYVEMFLRPRTQEYPDYIPAPPPDYENDYHGSLGRENVAMSNFMDSLGIAGMVAGGLAAAAPISAAMGGTFMASEAALFSNLSTGINTLTSRYSNTRGNR